MLVVEVPSVIKDLIEVLNKGIFMVLVLDVVEEEPLPSTSPFMDLRACF